MNVSWVLCDLKTGDVIEELPLRATELERTVSTATTLTGSLDVFDESCPPNWPDLLDPRRAMLVPVIGDGQLTTAYFIPPGRAFGGPSASIPLKSLEGIGDHVYCRDHDFYEDEDDEADIAAALLADVLAPSFGFEVATVATGKTSDRTYSYVEDRTVKSALDELGEADDGPEWTIRLAWADGKRQRVVKTIHVGPQVGSTTPATVFDDAAILDRRRLAGEYATHVVATSDGSGADRPMSPPVVDDSALAAGIPQWEARVAVPAIDDDVELARYAQAAGARRFGPGAETVELELDPNEPACPRLGLDFDAGDTVQLDSRARPDDPVDVVGPARVIGWRAEIEDGAITKVTPTFWKDPKEF